MAWMKLSCRCGFCADLDDFCRTPVFGELPYGQYQCPSCGYAWRRKESEHRVLRHGSAATFIPGKVELVAIEGRL
ncbi:MAG: hypothetical protein AB9919_02175 [Geobacteraceae bacterium]